MSGPVRFAPSPTGLLHVGNARMALVNALFAKHEGVESILRLDDTDAARSTVEFADAIQEDLGWLGLVWDRVERQSERMESYTQAFEKLKADGRIYACYETSEELEFKRRRRLSQHKPPIYDRAGLELDDAARATLEGEGRKPHWRFKLNHVEISWDDLVRGPVQFQGEHLSDPVLVREDGTFLYMLPSAVDDIDMKIGTVIRGEDHVANTAVQIQLFEALGGAVPGFAHLPLLTDIGGKGLSKRLGSMTVASLREDGIEAMALNSLLAHLGTSDDIEPFADLAALAETFDITHTGRGTPKFDPDQLRSLNAKFLHGLSLDAVSERLAAFDLDPLDEIFWNAVRANLNGLEDVRIWHTVCYGDIDPVAGDEDFLSAATALLPDGPWGPDTWKTWTGLIKEETGRKGKELFLPLRRALTGVDHGPELKDLLPVMGRQKTLARLAGNAG